MTMGLAAIAVIIVLVLGIVWFGVTVLRKLLAAGGSASEGPERIGEDAPR